MSTIVFKVNCVKEVIKNVLHSSDVNTMSFQPKKSNTKAPSYQFNKTKKDKFNNTKKNKSNRKVFNEDKIFARKVAKQNLVQQRNKVKNKNERYIAYDAMSKVKELSFLESAV